MLVIRRLTFEPRPSHLKTGERRADDKRDAASLCGDASQRLRRVRCLLSCASALRSQNSATAEGVFAVANQLLSQVIDANKLLERTAEEVGRMLTTTRYALPARVIPLFAPA